MQSRRLKGAGREFQRRLVNDDPVDVRKLDTFLLEALFEFLEQRCFKFGSVCVTADTQNRRANGSTFLPGNSIPLAPSAGLQLQKNLSSFADIDAL